MASDSIIVYSAGAGYDDVLAVGAAVRGLLVTGLRQGLALRGALAIGELDEIDLEDEPPAGHDWTARLRGWLDWDSSRLTSSKHGATGLERFSIPIS